MAATYEPIYTTTLGSNQTSVTLNSFGGYTDLVLVVAGNSSAAGAAYTLQFNGDTSSNYSQTYLYGSGSGSGASGRGSNGTEMNIGNTDQSNNQTTIINIMNYTNTTTYKTVISKGGGATIGAISYVGLWRKTPEAITSIRLGVNTGTINTNSVVSLYGIKAA